MDKELFLSKITEIGTCEDDVTRRTLLTELSDEVVSVFDSVATLTESNQSLTDANETLRNANMELFLRVGENKKQDEFEPEEKEKPKPRSLTEIYYDKKGE